MKSIKWIKKCLWTILIILVLIAALVIIIDPYFHYHKPINGMSYRLYEERYINDGISRQFDFDMIITGSSMAQNFKPSEAETLFGTTCVKETFSGAGFKETSDNLRRTFKHNPAVKSVIWAIDYNGFLRDKDWSDYSGFPTYLYDDNPFNDVFYIFNKSILYHGVLNNIMMTIKNEPSTTMDEYSAWDAEKTGLDGIFELYDRDNVPMDLPHSLTEDDYRMVYDNINENIVTLVNDYPDVTFYLFYPPYSICYWDEVNLTGTLERQLGAESVASSLLTACPNVKLYSYNDRYDLITDVNNYRDKEHYLSKTNSDILQWISNDEGRITIDNYEEVIAAERAYYGNYDYESIYSR